MVRRLSLGLLLLLLPVGVVWAQSCRKAFATPVNGKQAITIGATAVTVAAANTQRCSLLLYNTSPNPIMCTDFSTDGAPTATIGTPIAGGGKLALGMEGQGQWQCIRQGASDGTLYVTEGRP